MITSAIECNADDKCCTADDGNPCPACKAEEAYWRNLYYGSLKPCTLCFKKTPNDDGFCSDECREACKGDFR